MRLLLPHALALVLAASVVSARNIVLTEQEASDRHLSVQERTCADEHSAVVVSGSGALVTSGHGLDFTAHVCAAEDGRGHRATGKVLNTMHVSENGHALYHAHCAYVDKEHGFAYLGLEIEDMKGPSAMHMYGEDGERLSLEQSGAELMFESMTLAAASSSKEGNTEEGRKLAKAPTPKSTKAPKSSKSSKSSKCSNKVIFEQAVDQTFTYVENCPCCCLRENLNGTNALEAGEGKDAVTTCAACSGTEPASPGCCCDNCIRRRLVGTMVDAAEEVISGNEPKGTLAIFRFEKKGIDTAPSADRFAMSHHVAFDTTCEGFEDVVKTVQFTDEEVSDLTTGKFHIP